MQFHRLIALEGIDGAGTSSQMEPVAAALEARGYAVQRTHEPSTGAVGKLLRRQLAEQAASSAALGEGCLALLFAADRLAHLDQVVVPALGRGEVVLTDRYLWSSLAYQSAALSPAWVQAINEQAPAAGCTVWLACEPAEAKRRRAARGAPVERFEHDARQAAAHARYRSLAEQAADTGCLRIDGQQEPAAVTRDIVAGVLAHLGSAP